MIHALILIISFSVSAKTAWFPIGKDGANLNYSEKYSCEKEEGQECFNVGECPLDECDFVTEITQDDLGINVETKVLKNSETKKAQRQAEKEAKELEREEKKAKKQAAKDKVKAFKFKGTTIKELRDELNDYVKENAEVVE